MDNLDGLIERLRKRIAEASPLPWVYRPGQYDDWGWIRGVEQESEIGRYRPIVANAKDSNVREEALDQHRKDKTDPYGPNALLITEGVNALPDLLTTLETLTQENARLREAGWRDIESAPDNGSFVLVIGGRHIIASVEKADGGWWRMAQHDGLQSAPAHWMPLPPAPAGKALGGGDEQ